ncbi:hypothetical protein [Microbulbifer thermotolerans]|uniref:hypothetical protein n=1 Tax=Microbulbifer thermotolerans TaxID=252514 RepID=UPI00224AA4C6|nr:hypothetical protein [Microbulbifer thermotolerans]MCX2778970.1 hypothetical protein [Microbulbifer thermotolerans]MCX2806436.1 hypothetical protein [Microbulbifer thermotolerans]
MSYEHGIENLEDDVLTVAVQRWDNGYMLWQRGLTKEAGSDDGVYFEYDDQTNGGYNNVKECTVTTDGIHVVLANNELAHFYFNKGFDKFAELKSGLEKIYQGNEHVLEFCI